MGKRVLFIPPEYDCNIANAQILKDTCLVPCLLQKYYGYEATIAAYSIDEDFLHRHFPACKFICIKNSGNFNSDALTFIMNNAGEFDIFFMFGPYECYCEMASRYKEHNPGGKIYLKLDMNRYWLSRLIPAPYFRTLLESCDLVSIESAGLHRLINQELPFDFELIPNGYYETFATNPVSYSEKENIVLTVGRLGISAKQTDIMLKAFLEADLPGWQLRLVGGIAEEFKPLLKTFQEHPKFSQAVVFTGPIYDRQKLEQEYRRAKIFCMTSIVEAYAHVFAEAAKNGCYIISTDVEGASDVTDDGKYGLVLPVGDHGAIAGAFEKVCREEEFIKNAFAGMCSFASGELSWQYVLGKLNALFHLKGLV